MIDNEKTMQISEEIEQVAEGIEQVIEKEIKPGLELLGRARWQIESGNTTKAYELLKEAAKKFDVGFDNEASSVNALADDASDCYFDHEADPHPGYRVGQ